MSVTAAQIAKACDAPLYNVQIAWPLLVDALEAEGVNTPLVQLGMIATVGVETWVTQHGKNMTFLPIEEQGKFEILQAKYGKYWGRGQIQLTWKSNYERYGVRLDLDLLNHPELALDPTHSARIAAAYFVDANVVAACEARNWRDVRKRVNGGYNGWARFAGILTALGEPVAA